MALAARSASGSSAPCVRQRKSPTWSCISAEKAQAQRGLGALHRGEFEPGEMVALEHWCSSGFANTDLDLQLKNQGIHQLIVIGL